MNPCPECDRALQRVVHRVYAPDCPDCGIRRHAYMGSEELSKALDLVQFAYGPAARARAYERVKRERQRIDALAAAMPKKEKA